MWILQPNGAVAPSPKARVVSVGETNLSGAKFSNKKRIGQQIAQYLSMENFYPGLCNLITPELAAAPLHTLGLTVSITNVMNVDPSFFCMLSIFGKHPKLEGMLPGLNSAAMKMTDVKLHGKDWRVYGAVLLVKLHSSISKSTIRHKYMPLTQDSLDMLKRQDHIKVIYTDAEQGGALRDVPVAKIAIKIATDVSTAQRSPELDAARNASLAGPAMNVIPDLSSACCKEWPPLVGSPPGLTRRVHPNTTLEASCAEHVGLRGMGMVPSNPVSDEDQVDAVSAAEWSNKTAGENNVIEKVRDQGEGKVLVDENDSETCGDTDSTSKASTLSEDGASPGLDGNFLESAESAERAYGAGDVDTVAQQLSEPLPPEVEKTEQPTGQMIPTCSPEHGTCVKTPSSLVLVEIVFQDRAKKVRYESSMKIAELLSVCEQRMPQRGQSADPALKVCDRNGIEYGSTLSLGCLRAEAAQAATLDAEDGSLPLYIELDDWF